MIRTAKSRFPSGVWAMTLAAIVTGCNSAAPTQDQAAAGQSKQALADVGEMYRLYTATAKKPPQKVDDFRSAQAVAPAGFQAVNDGRVVVSWGATLTDTSEEGSSDSAAEVLAFEKDVPEKGGLVLMKNRTVKSMTVDEFKAAPKAGK